METKDLSKKNLTVEEIRDRAATTEKHLSLYNFEGLDLSGGIKAFWAKPLGKVVIIGGVTIGLIYLSGYALDLGAWWLRKYHRFHRAANPSAPSATPVPPKL